MQAHRFNVTINDDHRLSVDLPRDFPSGPAEVIVLAEASKTRKVDPGNDEGSMIGLFADEPDLMDEVCRAAMEDRATRRLRVTDG